MQKIKNKNLFIALGCIAAFAIALVLATLFDLQISDALADLRDGKYLSPNIFGRVFETIGEMPIYLFCVFAGAMLALNMRKRKKNALVIALLVFSAVVMVGMSCYMIYKLMKYLSQHFEFEDRLGGAFDFVIYIAFGIAFSALTLAVFEKTSSDVLNKIFKWSVIVLLTALISQLLTQGVKIFAGRARYRTMYVLDDFSLYRKWFEFGGKKTVTEDMASLGIASDGFKSFPSGHTTAAAMVLTLTALPQALGLKGKKYDIIMWSVAVVFTLTVAISRVVMGAHFLSDTLIGAFFTVVSFYISKLIADKCIDKLYKGKELSANVGIRIVEESIN